MAATTLQISCVHQRQHQDPHQRVVAVGGVKPDGSRWRLTELQAVSAIKSGTTHFFITGGGRTSRVVIDHHNAREFLKSQDDGDVPESLLGLPDFPA